MSTPLKMKHEEVQRKVDGDSDVFRFVARGDGEIIYTSPALEKALKVSNQPLLGKNLEEVLDLRYLEDDNEDYPIREYIGVDRTIMDSINSGCHRADLTFKNHTISEEFQFDWVSMPDNSQYLVASTQSILGVPEDNSGLVHEVLGLNVKRRPSNKDAEIDTSSAQNRLQANEVSHFMDISPNLMATLEENGDLIRFNRNFMKVLGYEEKDLIGKNLSNLISQADRPTFKNAFFALKEHSRQTTAEIFDITVETLVDTKSGTPLCIEWKFRAQEGVVYALGEDITEIRAQEASLNLHSSRLSEAQALAKMGHWRWVMDSGEISWSPELYNIFEQDQDFDLKMENIADLIHRRDLSRVIQGFQRAIIEKRDYDIEFRIYNKAGEIKFLRCEGRCEVDEEGEVQSLFGIIQDVTERMHYILDLRKAKESAEQAYAAKSRFLANMSHELRTPLNAIIGFSEMMQRQLLGPIGSDRYLDYITGIRESGEHLLDLISDILDMSKIEAGKYELVFEEVSLAKTLKLAVHMMEARATESDLKLVCDLGEEAEEEGLNIVADRRAVMQILLNILSNAIKFTQAEGTITVTAEKTKQNISIKIADTGIGIPANKIDSITKPFEQADCSYAKEHEGSGLGLAITKDLAELHGGRLSIESEVGEGTIVTVRLPLDARKNQNPDA